ncbi:DUF84 family protein [Salirhabdus sp. Marseille-P4669]|uniref:DUF84 family protein n=1 Tax=Salirhabdus sp. Marseille-P4669 TaxID=2042310 RepID=UPI000C7A0A6F|nr:DUF84 family protein [Salirhabdus sp. Marseille-P4669]
MKIIVGSKNPAKVNAVKDVFSDVEVKGLAVPSNVSAQPYSDEETLTGAINRAKACANSEAHTIGIGLEGGVMIIDNTLYVCNWGALVDEKGNIYKASGARIPLPDKFRDELSQGKELGDIMDDYTKSKGIRKKEGAVGVFTNQHVDRMSMFSHVVLLLKGQYEFNRASM